MAIIAGRVVADMTRNSGCSRAPGKRDSLDFIVVNIFSRNVRLMLGVQKEFGIDTKEQTGIHAVAFVASNLRCQIIQGIKVIKHEVECSVINVLPFILAASKRSSNSHRRKCTHNEYDVRVARLHLGGR